MRVALFVPAHKTAYIEKAKKLRHKDLTIIFDLEDSVPEKDKKKAVANVKKHARTRDWVRLYGNLPAYEVDEISDKVDGLVIPKADAWTYDRYHSLDPLHLIPIIETAAGVESAGELANHAGAVIFGQYDYAVSMKSDAYLKYASERVVNACKAHNVPVYNTPTYSLDPNDIVVHAQASYLLGFDGVCVLHPDHIAIIAKHAKPDCDDVAWAKEVIKRAKSGIFVHEKTIIGPPVLERARQILG